MLALGDKVRCEAYIKPSGNRYIIASERETEFGVASCYYWENGASESVEVEDCHSCNRYRIIEKAFSGVYVGTTTLCTRINAEGWDDSYGNSGFRTHCDEPKKFAIVYYADNKKRLVPIDKIKEATND